MLRAAAKSLAVLLVVVIGGLCLLYLASRLSGPSQEEREALAQLDAPPMQEGHNGFAELYAVDLDLPAAERAALLDADVAAFAASPEPGTDAVAAGTPRWRSRRDQMPSLDRGQADDPAWCQLRERDCLTRVRASPEAYSGMLARQAALLDRIEALSAYDRFTSPFPRRMDAPLTQYGKMSYLLTRNAGRYVAGETDQALAGTCSGIAQGKVLVEEGDSLLASMVGANLIRAHVDLLAAMLAELPRDQPLPATCDDILAAPLRTQDAFCHVMKSEGRLVVTGPRTMATTMKGEGIEAALDRMFFDAERSAARMAPIFTWSCGDRAAQLIAADAPLVNPPAAPSPWSLACVSNITGCILTDIAAPAYTDYGLRFQDSEAQLRTLSALLWLRARPGPIDADALAALPVDMTSAARPLRLDAEGATLGTPLYSHREKQSVADDVWRIPLPASRLQPVAASP